MKKILVIALALVLALGAIALVACGQEEEVTGKCLYSTKWGSYGCMVKVTVKNGTITGVTLLTDDQAKAIDSTWEAHRTTASWQENANPGDLGYEKAEAAYADWLNKTFKGKTVAEVKAWVAAATENGQSVTTEGIKLAGATQSSARIIVAVQDALSKLAA